MSNRVALTFKASRYNRSSQDIDISLQRTSRFDYKQDDFSEKHISSGIHILRKIGNYELEWPLIITVSYQGDLVFVESETPSIWGEGSNLDEALKSYEDFFLYDFKSYKDTPIENLDFFARQELKLYRTLLKISE